MGVLVANEAVRTAFYGIKEQIEIRDADGELLGYFTPYVSKEETELYEHAKTLFDPEEIKRREAANLPGRPLEEIMKRLQSLENAE